MKLKTFAFLICASILIFCQNTVLADDNSSNPHEGSQKEVGVITGALRVESGNAIPEHAVLLNVFHKDQMVLQIPKKTDSEGKYQFKNIFRSPDFHYIISAEYEGKLYGTKPISLDPKQSLIQLDLNLGNETLSAGGGGEEHKHDECPTCKGRKTSINEYQILAILLSVGVIVYLVFFRKKGGTHAAKTS